ncbi:calmodulin-lysine N-methyltransferase [Strongylocentrotus purpuratus]|uniref:Calmodulin-lysine N-methyltransferase n=1 Tax=Strongylocentrotus purpuratus TaxID=7668 RepID=A0A7M7HKU6_STRPU|nr:calmodulin-lysine N-methyltransferase [Strongylocentrotus purpuratus]|eukprot:XP_011666361.1 PREDICTED: calmodulin-lysine N-methyltransferase [Strongylocentrotus purpuratus]
MSSKTGLKENDRDAAKKRWKLLGKALMNKGFNNEITRKNITSEVSVRRFSSYGLLTTKKLPSISSSSDGTENYSWFQYSSPSHRDFCIDVRHLKEQFSPKELIGFNNTGNVCVWPSEEVLAHHCLTHRDLFREKTVCELGGGMTCLAGIAVACTSDAARVILTDGNDLSCKNIEVIVEKNKDRFTKTEVNIRNVRWNEESSFSDLRESVDVILSADCLFFDQYRSDLVHTIHSLLSADGMAVIFAPCRNRTLDKFCQQAKSSFHLTLEENYDPMVWNVYQQAKAQGKEVFDEDIHYPLKITLTKRGTQRSTIRAVLKVTRR